MESERKPPTREEVLEYAEKQIKYYIKENASYLPEEQKDEIRQEASIRLLSAYDRIDPEKGWMSFVQSHCWGSVMDYLRSGDGFEESGDKEEEDDPAAPKTQKAPKLKKRISLTSYDGEDRDLEHILGANGIFIEDEDPSEFMVHPNWDLIARLASRDEKVHLVAKILMGCTQTAEADNFGVSRERLSQRIREFFDELDKPENLHSKVINQTIYAFGLSQYFGMEPVDNGVGWDWPPVDLKSANSKEEIERFIQPSLFD